MSNPGRSADPKTTDSMEINRTRANAGAPATSISLDAGRSVASRPRNKVNQALAIAATINSQTEMKSSGAQSMGSTRGAGAKSGASTAGGSGGANSQSQSQSAGVTTGDDYEASKAADKSGKSRLTAAADERRMVADLDRFDANNENEDNLEDSF